MGLCPHFLSWCWVFCLAWGYAGLLHSITAAVHSCVHLSCCVKKSLFPCGCPLPLDITRSLPPLVRWSLNLGRRGSVYMFHLGMSIVSYSLYPGQLCVCLCWSSYTENWSFPNEGYKSSVIGHWELFSDLWTDICPKIGYDDSTAKLMYRIDVHHVGRKGEWIFIRDDYVSSSLNKSEWRNNKVYKKHYLLTCTWKCNGFFS